MVPQTPVPVGHGTHRGESPVLRCQPCPALLRDESLLGDEFYLKGVIRRKLSFNNRASKRGENTKLPSGAHLLLGGTRIAQSCSPSARKAPGAPGLSPLLLCRSIPDPKALGRPLRARPSHGSGVMGAQRWSCAVGGRVETARSSL